MDLPALALVCCLRQTCMNKARPPFEERALRIKGTTQGPARA